MSYAPGRAGCFALGEGRTGHASWSAAPRRELVEARVAAGLAHQAAERRLLLARRRGAGVGGPAVDELVDHVGEVAGEGGHEPRQRAGRAEVAAEDLEPSGQLAVAA